MFSILFRLKNPKKSLLDYTRQKDNYKRTTGYLAGRFFAIV